MNALTNTWNQFFNTILQLHPEVQNIPSELGKTDSTLTLPLQLLELYEITNGVSISGYMPDQFGKMQMTFSLLPIDEVESEYKNLMRMTPRKSSLWNMLPQMIRTMTAGDEAEAVWHPTWIPFAEDGAGSYQFVKSSGSKAVYQYDCSTWAIRKCGSSLAAYFKKVTSKIESGAVKLIILE